MLHVLFEDDKVATEELTVEVGGGLAKRQRVGRLLEFSDFVRALSLRIFVLNDHIDLDEPQVEVFVDRDGLQMVWQYDRVCSDDLDSLLAGNLILRHHLCILDHCCSVHFSCESGELGVLTCFHGCNGLR